RSARSPASSSAADSHCSQLSSSFGCFSRYAAHGGRVMSERPTYRPVYKALHRPLTVCGVDRRLFFLALLLGAATFNLFYSFLAGLLMFAGLYGFALWSTRRDPEMLRILLSSSRTRRRYDPGKHDRSDLEISSW